MNTIDYYNNNALDYFYQTINADMSKQYELFLKYLNNNSKILDFGCGSGRDTLYFKNLGYEVDAIDGSIELCKLASKFTNITVKCMDFKDFKMVDYYDGIWACATLLHLPKKDLISILNNLRDSIKNDGIIYASVKNGSGAEITSEGRFYSYYTNEEFTNICSKANLNVIDFYSSKSVINLNENKYWNSYILKKWKRRYYGII